MRAKPSQIRHVPIKPAEADQVAMRGKDSVCEFREEKIARAAARVSMKPGAGGRRYRLRRSRRALRFLLPILRRRRGFDIRESPFHLPKVTSVARHSSRVSYPDVTFTSSCRDFPFHSIPPAI